MTKTTVKKLPKSEMQITGEITFEALLKYRADAVKKISSSVKIPGFRTGHIPEKVLIKEIGEHAILGEMAESALAFAYPEILAEHKIFPLSRPQIEYTQLAADKPFTFTITVAVMPQIMLADYKKTAAEKNKQPQEKIEVTEKDIEELSTAVRKSHIDHSKHDHSVSKEEHDKQLEQEMPELSDEFAKKVGFADLAAFNEKIKENIIKEKEQKAKEKKRLEIIDAVIEKTEIDVPQVLVDSELNKMTEQFKGDIARMGATLESYLNHIKKTESDMRNDWTPDAIKRVKFQLILNKIATDEKIEADKDALDAEVKQILSFYKDADPERARDYAETILINEKVFRFLESQE